MHAHTHTHTVSYSAPHGAALSLLSIPARHGYPPPSSLPAEMSHAQERLACATNGTAPTLFMFANRPDATISFMYGCTRPGRWKNNNDGGKQSRGRGHIDPERASGLRIFVLDDCVFIVICSCYIGANARGKSLRPRVCSGALTPGAFELLRAATIDVSDFRKSPRPKLSARPSRTPSRRMWYEL